MHSTLYRVCTIRLDDSRLPDKYSSADRRFSDSEMQKRTMLLIAAALAVLVVAGTFATLALADSPASPSLQVGEMFEIQSVKAYVTLPSVNFTSQNTYSASFSLLLNITSVSPTNASLRVLTGEMTLGPLGISNIHGRGMIAKLDNETLIRVIGEGSNSRIGGLRFFLIGHFVMTAKGLILRLTGLIDTHKADAVLLARAAFLKAQQVTQPLFA